MEKIENLRFYIPLIFAASIFLGPVFNFVMFFYKKIPNTFWSFYITTMQFADIMALTFILFSVVFVITYTFLKNIAKEPAIAISLIIIGFSCIYAAFTTTWPFYVMTFIIIGGTIAFALPIIFTLMNDITKTEGARFFHLSIIPVSSVIWLLIQGIIFEVLGMQLWRILYIIIGIINFVSAPILFLYKERE
ncbi:MAG: hypothetical protein ACFFAQ_10035 [Promethearchaeota archaeon]